MNKIIWIWSIWSTYSVNKVKNFRKQPVPFYFWLLQMPKTLQKQQKYTFPSSMSSWNPLSCSANGTLSLHFEESYRYSPNNGTYRSGLECQVVVYEQSCKDNWLSVFMCRLQSLWCHFSVISIVLKAKPATAASLSMRIFCANKWYIDKTSRIS